MVITNLLEANEELIRQNKIKDMRIEDLHERIRRILNIQVKGKEINTDTLIQMANGTNKVIVCSDPDRCHIIRLKAKQMGCQIKVIPMCNWDAIRSCENILIDNVISVIEILLRIIGCHCKVEMITLKPGEGE